MTFPTGTISANDIRAQLAYNNTAGAQTPVSLNDLPVRQAADKLSGAVSYGDLRGKNVYFSGTVTWGVWSPSPYTTVYGLYAPYSGSIGTTSYYRLVNILYGPGYPDALPIIFANYNSYPATVQFSISTTYGDTPIPAITSPYVNVYIDGTKYALTADAYNSNSWGWNSDPLNLASRAGQTSVVVITY
jgi:hypothetical protein